MAEKDDAKTLSQVASGARQFASQNSDPVRVDEFPALEFLKVYDREPPEKTWKARWQAACGAANDDKATKVFTNTHRMVALKSSSVWQQLGDGAGGYDDTLGNPLWKLKVLKEFSHGQARFKVIGFEQKPIPFGISEPLCPSCGLKLIERIAVFYPGIIRIKWLCNCGFEKTTNQTLAETKREAARIGNIPVAGIER